MVSGGGREQQLISSRFSKHSNEDRDNIDRPFTLEEIKRAIDRCGNDKAPGPDGFSFKFIKRFWDLIKDDILACVKHFEGNGLFSSGCNSSFIALIPKNKDPLVLKDFRPVNLVGCLYKIVSKIISFRLKSVIGKVVSHEQSAYIEGRNITDGPLILNELITWAKKTKKKMMVFKVDFDKAFDSLNWGFLDSVMEQMNFSARWRRWIHGCLSSGKASVLLNGSPTEEFQIKRGVRQGDPMASFLFVLAMEGLSVSIKEACNQFLYNGISLPNYGPCITHLMYADDVTFIGEWSESNLLNLNRVLRCFYIASGLKVNLLKSRLFGVGVEEFDLIRFANILSCEPAVFPCYFLGLPIGVNMKLSRNWNVVIEKFKSKLSKWKSKMMSFGGRLTLVNSVLSSLPLYYFSLFKAPKKVINSLESIRRNFLWGSYGENRKIHWIAWSDIAKPRKFGGLGVNCLKEMNIALLTKWIWRLRSQPHSLWASCIRSIHCLRGIHSEKLAKKSLSGIWLSITEAIRDLKEWNIEIDKCLVLKLRKGDKFMFWKDRWLGSNTFKDLFPRLYSLEVSKNSLVSDKVESTGLEENNLSWKRAVRRGLETRELTELCDTLRDVHLSSELDVWSWIIASNGIFSVQSLRNEIAKNRWSRSDRKFHWLRMVPFNVNCFVWRFVRNRIAVMDNLASRGVRLDSSRCCCCDFVIESLQHLFFECSFAKDTWDAVASWCSVFNASPVNLDSFNDILICNGNSASLKVLKVGIAYASVWSIWKARNDAVFKKIIPCVARIIDEIKVSVFNWLKYRCSKEIDWNVWLVSPDRCML
ncbi:hypothetical protein L1887_22495 [Cichorium endivia]|nr:hypothetical protein L1887_22495 [Cichorium endivia]